MYKKLLLLFTVFILPFCLFAQENEKENLLFDTHYINVSLIKPIVTFVPRYHIGYVTHLDSIRQVGIEIGIGTRGIFTGDTQNSFYIGDRYSSFYIAPEIRWRIRQKKRTFEYISLEPFFLTHSDRFSNRTFSNFNNRTIVNQDNLTVTRYERADYNRIKVGVNFNLGIIAFFTNNFGMDFKIGLGLQSRHVRFKNIINSSIVGNQFDEESFDFGTRNFITDEGQQTSVNLNLDYKLFYRF